MIVTGRPTRPSQASPHSRKPRPQKRVMSLRRLPIVKHGVDDDRSEIVDRLDRSLLDQWGSCQGGKQRLALATKLVALLQQKRESSLLSGCSGCKHNMDEVVSILLFKRASASLRISNLQATVLHSDHEDANEVGLSLESTKATLLLMEELLRHKRLNLATEYVDTNLSVCQLFKFPKLAGLACKIASSVFRVVGFHKFFRHHGRVKKFASQIAKLPESNLVSEMVKIVLQQIEIEKINPDATVPPPLADPSVEFQQACKQAYRELLLNESSQIRSVFMQVCAEKMFLLPHGQQLRHSEMIDAAVSLLRSNLFNVEAIGAAFSLIKKILDEHSSADPAPPSCEKNVESQQLLSGLLKLLNNAPLPEGVTSFEGRDYDSKKLVSAQAAALRLLQIMAARTDIYSSFMDSKVVVRNALGSLCNFDSFAVQVEALNLLRCFIPEVGTSDPTYPIAVSLLRLLVGDSLYKKLISLHHYLQRASSTSPSPARKKKWKLAIAAATSSVESSGGGKIISSDALVRKFITDNFHREYVDALQGALRKIGWLVDDGAQCSNSETSNTVSLAVTTKLLGRLSSKRKDSAVLAPGKGRYHDEGVIHLPYENKSRQHQSRGSNRSALTADAESALASSASSPRPVQDHHRGYYRPLGFVSLSSSDNGNGNGNGNGSDEVENCSLVQSVANREVLSFNRRMSQGVKSVLSVEESEAHSIAEDLLKQVQIAEKINKGAETTIAARLGLASMQEDIEILDSVDKAMEILAARSQRRHGKVKIFVDRVDPQARISARQKAQNPIGWNALSGHVSKKNPVAAAMLHGYCCGFNLAEMGEKKFLRNN